jgi:hypothetical protein
VFVDRICWGREVVWACYLSVQHVSLGRRLGFTRQPSTDHHRIGGPVRQRRATLADPLTDAVAALHECRITNGRS